MSNNRITEQKALTAVLGFRDRIPQIGSRTTGCVGLYCLIYWFSEQQKVPDISVHQLNSMYTSMGKKKLQN